MWNEFDEDRSGHYVLIWTPSVVIQKVVPLEFDIGTSCGLVFNKDNT